MSNGKPRLILLLLSSRITQSLKCQKEVQISSPVLWCDLVFYSRLGVPQGRCGQVRKISPPRRFDPRTAQPVGSCYID
jgi:hypothetical protein